MFKWKDIFKKNLRETACFKEQKAETHIKEN